MDASCHMFKWAMLHISGHGLSDGAMAVGPQGPGSDGSSSTHASTSNTPCFEAGTMSAFVPFSARRRIRGRGRAGGGGEGVGRGGGCG